MHNEAEDEEGRQDNTQGPAQERVKTDAFVVARILPARTKEDIWF